MLFSVLFCHLNIIRYPWISRSITKKPHIAGKENNMRVIKSLQDHWLKIGLDQVTLTPYRVLLSYPNSTDPNFVELLDNDNTLRYKSPDKEKAFRSEENDTDIVQPFVAYSKSGDVYVSTKRSFI